MKHIAPLAGLAAALLLAGGHAQAAPVAAPGFTPCPDSGSDPALAGSLCVRASAPLDYGKPESGQVELFVRKFPAAGRSLGQVWLIAGGPGESGAAFYPLLATIRAAFAGYDLIIPDHRGTGFSSRICAREEAADSPGGTALDGAEWGSCFAAMAQAPERTRSFTVSNAARDLNLLMARYSEGRKTWLYGVSYGTQLVLRTLTVSPPPHLDGVVLDSLVPPETTDEWDLSHRSAVVDAVGRRVLAEGPAEAALRAVEADPKLSAMTPGGNPKLFFGMLLDVPALRARIPAAAAGLARGDPAEAKSAAAGLEAFQKELARYPQSPASIPLVSLISASENTARPDLTKAQVAAEEAPMLFTSSLPGILAGGGSDAYPRDGAFGRHPASMPPTLVLQGDMDPKTPHEGALAHIRLLPDLRKIELVTVQGGPHFLMLTAPDCFRRAVSAFVAKRTTAGACKAEN